jgi:hypothetical protein
MEENLAMIESFRTLLRHEDRNMAKKALGTIVAALMLFPAVAFAASGKTDCTVRDLQGSWGFLSTGQALDSQGTPQPYAAAGVLALAADGTFTVTGTQTIDGTVSAFSPTGGTWTVDASDCKGTALSQDKSRFFHFVVDGAPPQIEFVRTDLGYIVTGKAKQMAENCTLSNISGSYGYAFNAIVFDVTVENKHFPEAFFSASGAVKISPKNSLDDQLVLRDTANFGGLLKHRHYEGTITIAPDCEGKVVVTLPPGAPTDNNPIHIDTFWVNDRNSVFLIQTDHNTFIAAEATALRSP